MTSSVCLYLISLTFTGSGLAGFAIGLFMQICAFGLFSYFVIRVTS